MRLAPQASVVMVTAYASIETAVEAMRRGAFDYLPKPCTPDQVRQVLARIEQTKRLERRVAELESRFGATEPESDLTSRSPAMQKLLEIAFKVAESEAFSCSVRAGRAKACSRERFISAVSDAVEHLSR